MMNDHKAIIVLGSSRKKKNTFVFAKAMKASFEKRGFSTELFYSIDLYRGLTQPFIQAINASQMICILSPLYADYMPYHLVKLLELMEAQPDLNLRGKKGFGFSQCAFPFYRLNECSVKAMALFAKQMNMDWTGSLMYGGAGLMDCESLEQMGKKGRKMIRAFDLAVEGMIQTSTVPEKSQEMLAMTIPGFLKRPVMWMINKNVREVEKEVGQPLDVQAYR